MRVLSTPRLQLHPVALEDVDAMWPYVSDPELPRRMTWEAHRDRSETIAFVERSIAESEKDAGYKFSIKKDGVFAGTIGFHEVTRKVRAWRMDRAELGYWIGGEFRNQGLITEAAREVMRFGFEQLQLHKIVVGCSSDNAASKKVIEKLGFRFLCEQRDHFFRDDRWWNHLAYEMLVDEWRLTVEKAAADSQNSRA